MTTDKTQLKAQYSQKDTFITTSCSGMYVHVYVHVCRKSIVQIKCTQTIQLQELHREREREREREGEREREKEREREREKREFLQIKQITNRYNSIN